MTKPNNTLIVTVLDRSGSMSTCINPTIEGYNAFLTSQKNSQKELNDEVKVTFVQFDTEYELKYNMIPIDNAYLLSRDNFVPRGGTALYDAIGRTMVDVGKKLYETPEHERPSKVLFVIVTDGEENSSREYRDVSIIKDMIEHQKQKYNWNFVFLAANIDAHKVGSSLGVANAMNFNSNDMVKTRAMYNSMDSFTKCYRSSGYIDPKDLQDNL